MGWATKTLLGLGGTRQESLGTRRHGQHLPEKMGSQAGDPHVEGISAPSPTSHAPPRRWSRTFIRSRAAVYSPVHWTAVCTSRTSAAKPQSLRSRHSLFSSTAPSKKTVKAGRAGGGSSGFGCPTVDPKFTQAHSADTLPPLSLLPLPINGTWSSCRASAAPHHLLFCL